MQPGPMRSRSRPAADRQQQQRRPWGYSSGAPYPPQTRRRSGSGSASSTGRGSGSPGTSAGRRSNSPAGTRRPSKPAPKQRAPATTREPEAVRYDHLSTSDLIKAIHDLTPANAPGAAPAIREDIETSAKSEPTSATPQWPAKDRSDLHTPSKGLFVSATYAGTDWALPPSDEMYSLMMCLHEAGFMGEKRMVAENLASAPTRQGVLELLDWLADGARPGDMLMLVMQGHGASIAGTGGHANTGFAPIDWKSSGVLSEEDVCGALVDKLPAGVRLMCIFDIAHGGAVLEMPRAVEVTNAGCEVVCGRLIRCRADVWTLAMSHAASPPTVPSGELISAAASAIASAESRSSIANVLQHMLEIIVGRLAMAHELAHPTVVLGGTVSTVMPGDPFSIAFPTGRSAPPQVSSADPPMMEPVEHSGDSGVPAGASAVPDPEHVLSQHHASMMSVATPMPPPSVQHAVANTSAMQLGQNEIKPSFVRSASPCPPTASTESRRGAPLPAVLPTTPTSASAPSQPGVGRVVGGATKALIVSDDDATTRSVARFLNRQGFVAETRVVATARCTQEDVWWLVDDVQPGDSLFLSLEVGEDAQGTALVDAARGVLLGSLPQGCRLTWVLECGGVPRHPVLHQYLTPGGEGAVTYERTQPSRGVLFCVSGGEGTTAGYISAVNRNPATTASQLVSLVDVMMRYQREATGSPRGAGCASTVRLSCSRRVGMSSVMHLGVLPSEDAHCGVSRPPPRNTSAISASTHAAPAAPSWSVASQVHTAPDDSTAASTQTPHDAAPPAAAHCTSQPMPQPSADASSIPTHVPPKPEAVAMPNRNSTPHAPPPAAEDYPLLLMDFCHKYFPTRLPTLQQLLQAHRGREHALCAALAEEAGYAGYFDARDSVMRFYRRVNPTKLARVDAILGEYMNSWDELYQDLEERYGEPVPRANAVAMPSMPTTSHPLPAQHPPQWRQPDFDDAPPSSIPQHSHPQPAGPQVNSQHMPSAFSTPLPRASHSDNPAAIIADARVPQSGSVSSIAHAPQGAPDFTMHESYLMNAFADVGRMGAETEGFTMHDRYQQLPAQAQARRAVLPPQHFQSAESRRSPSGGAMQPDGMAAGIPKWWPPQVARTEAGGAMDAPPAQPPAWHGYVHTESDPTDCVLRPLVRDPDYCGGAPPQPREGCASAGREPSCPWQQGVAPESPPRPSHLVMPQEHGVADTMADTAPAPRSATGSSGDISQRRLAAEEMYKALKQDTDTYSRRVAAIREATQYERDAGLMYADPSVLTRLT